MAAILLASRLCCWANGGGTVFHPHPEPLGNRRSWLAHVLRPEGELQLDAGACAALQHRGASLLLVGVTAVRGEFAANQPVQLLDPDGEDLGRGLCSMDSDQLRAAMNDLSLIHISEPTRPY